MPNLHFPLPQSLRQEFNNNKKGASNYPEFTLCDPLCAMVTANTNPEREGGGTPICSIKKNPKHYFKCHAPIQPQSLRDEYGVTWTVLSKEPNFPVQLHWLFRCNCSAPAAIFPSSTARRSLHIW